MIEKLILGTAALGGLPYGYQGVTVEGDDAVDIIEFAIECGIRCFDTSPLYGDAERILARVLGRHRHTFDVYSKTNGDIDLVIDSARMFSQKPIFLWHNWSPLQLIPSGWIKGVTSYSRDLTELPPGLVQLDWNLLNQKATQIKRDPKTVVIARSIFLQGALSDSYPPTNLVAHADKARALARTYGYSGVKQLAIIAAIMNPNIAAVVIGCTQKSQIMECIEMVDRFKDSIYPDISSLNVPDEELTDPRLFA